MPDASMELPFYTIGHSTRTIEEFVALLRHAGVEAVVDIRTVPRSRTNPQYNRDSLPDSLAPFGISYQHMADLGGLRGKSHTVDPDVNGFWQNQSFHNYADYTLSDGFRSALAKLITFGEQHRSTVMCAEAVWWRCHRRIVADNLMARGKKVFHLMGADRIEPARLTEGASVRPDGTLTYPAPSPHLPLLAPAPDGGQ